jgi:antitoxin MazE
MKSRIVKIGNSQGIRIPKPLIEQTGINDEVEIEVSGNALVIRPARPPRTGWEEAFHAMSAAGDDKLLEAESVETSRWDSTEWEW